MFKFHFQDVVVVARAIFHKPLAESLDEAIRRFLAGKEKDDVKIIDAAAGTGLIGVELNKLGYTNLCALDISPKMLDEAKKKNVYTKFICSSLSDRPNPEIAPKEFDALICGGSMLVGHIGPSALIEMIRIIKIGKLTSAFAKYLSQKTKSRQTNKQGKITIVTNFILSLSS